MPFYLHSKLNDFSLFIPVRNATYFFVFTKVDEEKKNAHTFFFKPISCNSYAVADISFGKLNTYPIFNFAYEIGKCKRKTHKTYKFNNKKYLHNQHKIIYYLSREKKQVSNFSD